MLKGGLIPSKGEGRRLVQQGGVSVNNEKISDVSTAFSKDDFTDGLIVKKGKKVYHRFLV
jgi:tyrosyl-tRNA synthetase